MVEAALKAAPMLRRVLGIVAAIAAAPVLLFLLMALMSWVLHGFPWPRLHIGFFIALVAFGLLPFVALPLPLLTASLISLGLAWLLERAGLRSRLPYMFLGAVTGPALVLWITWSLSSKPSPHDWTKMLSGMPAFAAPAGALCGWIYWRIAIGRTPGSARAIDPG